MGSNRFGVPNYNDEGARSITGTSYFYGDQHKLTDAGLIDEYFLAGTPVLLGTGKTLFAGVQKRNLRLLEARQFKSGNMLLR